MKKAATIEDLRGEPRSPEILAALERNRIDLDAIERGEPNGEPQPSMLEPVERSLVSSEENGPAMSPQAFQSRPRPSETVVLEFDPGSDNKDVPGFAVTFEVSECCITPHTISLALAYNFSFSTTCAAMFKLHRGGKVYHVIFAGGVFEFPHLKLKGLSFLRNKPAEVEGV